MKTAKDENKQATLGEDQLNEVSGGVVFKDDRPERKDGRPERKDGRPERKDERPERRV